MEFKPVSVVGDGNVEKKVTKERLRNFVNNIDIKVEINGSGVVHSHDENGVPYGKESRKGGGEKRPMPD